MMSPRRLQSVGETMTHRQAGGLIYRLIILPAAFLLTWAAVTVVVGTVLEAFFGQGMLFSDNPDRPNSLLFTLLAYAIGFTGAMFYYRSPFVRRRPFLGCLLGFISIIPAGMIVERMAPALSFLGLR